MTTRDTQKLFSLINKPITIGGRQVDNRLFLAPMAGLGHIAFREVMEGYGGYGLLFTGMCSAKAVPQENRRISHVFSWRDEELPRLVCQIFGSEPDEMARAAKRIEDEGFFGVDINFGCSVAAICKREAGAALLKDPDRAVAIVKAVRRAVSFPLFVKFRTGWSDEPHKAAELAKRFEDAGADAMVFHPRISPDRRSKPPKWDHIRIIKEAVSVPVFGNGDVFDRNDALKMMGTTGCDGLALGRIAIAKPWIFKTFTEGWEPDDSEYRRCALHMGEVLLKHYEPHMAIKLYQKLALYYMANFSFGNRMFGSLKRPQSMDQLMDTVGEMFKETPMLTSRPNMHLFV